MNKSEFKEKLIEFLDWWRDECNNDVIHPSNDAIDEFISINFDAQAESRSVGNNEQ